MLTGCSRWGALVASRVRGPVWKVSHTFGERALVVRRPRSAWGVCSATALLEMPRRLQSTRGPQDAGEDVPNGAPPVVKKTRAATRSRKPKTSGTVQPESETARPPEPPEGEAPAAAKPKRNGRKQSAVAKTAARKELSAESTEGAATNRNGDSSQTGPEAATSVGGSEGGMDPEDTPATPSKASELPDLGIEEGIRFFSNVQSDTRRAIKDSLLVYNTITGRMASHYSPAIKILLDIGFSLNENRQLVVTDTEKLNQLAEKFQSGETSVDALKWPPSIARKLASVLSNKVITNPGETLQKLLQGKINAISLSRYASVVAGTSTEKGSVEVNDGLEIQQGENSHDVKLNEEQERAIEIALRGHHLYIGGSAGTGKTVLLRILCRRLQAHSLRVAMTATTGVAGCHIGGCTFHHAFGVSSQGEFIRRGGMLDYDVVIIDEVSMLSQRLFESFDAVLREEAGTPDLPFGGVQIILCGDFLQLGSINESSVIYSRTFQKNFVKMRLQTIVRQNEYPEFAADLQLMRRGIVPENLTKKVQQLPPGTMVPAAVNLLPTNKEVHTANEKEMSRLEGDAFLFLPETGITALRCESTATMLLRTTPEFNEEEFGKHVRSLLQATLDLPRASLLSLYRMYEDGHAMRVVLPPGESVTWKRAMKDRFLEIAPLINEIELGATVTEIVPEADGLHTADGEEYLQRQMTKHPIALPLTLKKGCRVLLRCNLSSDLVNGSIGTVVDFVECQRNNFPEYIRHDTLDNCIERYRVFCVTECAMPIAMVPVVQFHNGKTIAIPPREFTVGGFPSTQYYSLSSVSIPLTLAYAFTVHKVQGLTLVGRVHLELSRMWPCEHLLYVAMSRVRNPDQLSMSSFEPNMIVANKDCVGFDVKLRDAKSLTQEVLKKYPVSSWKRCTDTIFHLRRQGSSLRHLLQEAAGRPQSASGSRAENSAADTSGDGLSEASEPLPAHLLAVENSVIVARRMRKLVRHVERVAKQRSMRQRLREAGQEQEALAGSTATSPSTTEDESIQHV